MLDIDWGSFDDEDGWIPSRAYSGVCVYASFLCRHGLAVTAPVPCHH